MNTTSHSISGAKINRSALFQLYDFHDNFQQTLKGTRLFTLIKTELCYGPQSRMAALGGEMQIPLKSNIAHINTIWDDEDIASGYTLLGNQQGATGSTTALGVSVIMSSKSLYTVQAAMSINLRRDLLRVPAITQPTANFHLEPWWPQNLDHSGPIAWIAILLYCFLPESFQGK